MKIKIISDLHLDHYPFSEFPNLDNNENCDMLINIGDLCDGLNFDIWNWYKNISKQYTYSLYVFGNHDFYNQEYLTVKSKFFEYVFNSNIKILDCNSFDIPHSNKKILGCTLWSKIFPQNEYYISKSMSDYKLIKFNDKLIQVEHTNRFFEIQKTWLENNIQQNDIVITHHLPSFYCIDSYYKGSNINEGFASNLDNMILEKKPKYWLFGHTHFSFDNIIGNTRLICNPQGYFHQKNKKFNRQLIFEI